MGKLDVARRTLEKKTAAEKCDLHQCYQEAVQNPRKELINLLQIYHETRQLHRLDTLPPYILREDFCGTAILCQEWVEKSVERQAIGVDIDSNVLKYGREHFRDLSVSERTNLVCSDVLTIDNQTLPKVDILVALNYGLCYFHSHSRLVQYLRQTMSALKPGGVFVCDGFGGKRSLMEKWEFRRPCSTFDYVFEQQPAGFLDSCSSCSISFRFREDGSWARRAFRYHFRLWSVAEVHDAFREVGFSGIQVWVGESRMTAAQSDNDVSDPDDDSGHLAFTRITDPSFIPKADCWNVYIAGLVPIYN